jgi:hypothetical protein
MYITIFITQNTSRWIETEPVALVTTVFALILKLDCSRLEIESSTHGTAASIDWS